MFNVLQSSLKFVFENLPVSMANPNRVVKGYLMLWILRNLMRHHCVLIFVFIAKKKIPS